MASTSGSMRRQRQRGGFALLFAVVLLALVGMILAGLARRSLDAALRASQRHEDLQLEWGARTLERALVRQAPRVLAERLDVQEVRPPFGLPLRVDVVGRQCKASLAIDDESAKLNLNRMRAIGGAAGLERALPVVGLGDVAAYLPSFWRRGAVRLDSFGEVFPLTAVPAKTRPQDWILERSRQVTLWGDGKLNLNRAAQPALEAVCREAIGPTAASQLTALRSAEPELGLEALIEKLELESGQPERLRTWLVEESKCFSVWLEFRTIHRRSTRLIVFDRRGETLARFCW